MRAEDGQVILPSVFAREIGSGVTLEMSIVLRQKTDFQDAKTRCPRCKFMNLSVTTVRGWFEWWVSPKLCPPSWSLSDIIVVVLDVLVIFK
jgi:hypothetical protein